MKQQRVPCRQGFFLALILVLLSPTAGSAAGNAPGIQDHAAIQAAARAYLQEVAQDHHGAGVQVRVVPGRLDPRLRLRACGEPLQASLPPGARLMGNTTVGVRCGGPAPWRLFVPMEVRVSGEVLVSRRPLPRDTVLSRDDVRLERRDLDGLHSGYLVDPQRVQGMVLRRSLQAGTVLTPQLVEPRQLVHRGQKVTLMAQNPAISVRVRGEALGDGAYGERVRVRNLSSGRVVEGRVLSSGVVGVTM
ncbi:flagellar basal body P-ring formation chaperone FlgA [Ectothiorhodospira mobilis]|uniref:flagellar basal body P-ring formation chaperone FlgA n=1 Tax=Ectothiorhodospira mobilis TaxID=195064 RepID=UPI0019044E78|nr:flagellar basal body P-ring formation chaperone FlgA [Ectothiorhodospira mobilis]MBK1691551.1 flagella basal body P-ring formation protein FlgA [Ectothiorhodospira mobilis]